MKKKDTRVGIVAAVILGAILLLSGVGKLVVPPAPGHTIIELGDLIHILPYVEIGLGALLILGVGVKILALISAGLVIGFAINNIWLLLTYGFITCGQCLGWGIDTWVGASLFVDLVMLIMAVLAYKYSRGNLTTLRMQYLGSKPIGVDL